MLGFGKICPAVRGDGSPHSTTRFAFSLQGLILTYPWTCSQAFAALHLGHDEAAARWLNRSIDTYLRLPAVYFLAMAALGTLDSWMKPEQRSVTGPAKSDLQCGDFASARQ